MFNEHFFILQFKNGKDDFMKRTISILLAFLMVSIPLYVFADAEYMPKGLKAAQEQYAELISEAIEQSEYEEEQIDKEHIFIVEHTSPIPMRKQDEAVWLYVALPIEGTSDISYAHFDKGEYVMAITNFAPLKGMKTPYGDVLQEYIEKNNLSEPACITNVWVIERVHVFAYRLKCDDTEYIIPYHFTEDTQFNLSENEDCKIELGKAYTMDAFLTICEKEAELFAADRKTESEQEKEDSHTYIDRDGELSTKPEEKPTEDKSEQKPETSVTEKEEISDDEEPARVYTFEELTGLSRKEIDHIVIRKGVDGIGYMTSYEKVIDDIYKAINTRSFRPYEKEGNSGGWLYEIRFFDKDNSAYSYTISTGMVADKKGGITFRTSDEKELKSVVEKAYTLIANNCSDWSCDYIAEAKDMGFLEGLKGISYREAVTREMFCEIIYNMLTKNDSEAIPVEVRKTPFVDADNEKITALYHSEIIKGKGEKMFAPGDHLTREEAATILVRVVNQFMPDTAVTERYFAYDDMDAVSDWAADAVQIISNLGVMNGVGENKFAPHDTYTAEQAIATVIRLYHIE